jgi:hypothetical protein
MTTRYEAELSAMSTKHKDELSANSISMSAIHKRLKLKVLQLFLAKNDILAFKNGYDNAESNEGRSLINTLKIPYDKTEKRLTNQLKVSLIILAL